MKRLFRIRVSDDAPQLVIDPEAPYASEFTTLDGSSKVLLSTNKSFIAKPNSNYPWQQVYAVAPGCFALSEEAWEECEDIYYLLTLGNELLSAGDSQFAFRIINPTSFAPPPTDANHPFDLDNFSAPIFRLRNHEPTHLFCLSGTEAPCNEFKHCYDQFGFTGLNFEEVWSGE